MPDLKGPSADALCKNHDIDGIIELQKISQKSRASLYRWYWEDPKYFKIIVLGCAAYKLITETGE